MFPVCQLTLFAFFSNLITVQWYKVNNPKWVDLKGTRDVENYLNLLICCQSLPRGLLSISLPLLSFFLLVIQTLLNFKGNSHMEMFHLIFVCAKGPPLCKYSGIALTYKSDVF